MDKEIKIGFQYPINCGISHKLSLETNSQKYSKASYQLFKKKLIIL